MCHDTTKLTPTDNGKTIATDISTIAYNSILVYYSITTMITYKFALEWYSCSYCLLFCLLSFQLSLFLFLFSLFLLLLQLLLFSFLFLHLLESLSYPGRQRLTLSSILKWKKIKILLQTIYALVLLSVSNTTVTLEYLT